MSSETELVPEEKSLLNTFHVEGKLLSGHPCCDPQIQTG